MSSDPSACFWGQVHFGELPESPIVRQFLGLCDPPLAVTECYSSLPCLHGQPLRTVTQHLRGSTP
eukprot:2159542-Alexandrium_andersonii.AAC.1